MFRLTRSLLLPLCLLLLLLLFPARLPGDAGEATTRTDALRALLTARETVATEVAQLRQDLALAQAEIDRQRIEAALADRTDQLEELKQRFRESVAGVDISLFVTEEKEPFSWEQTLGKILEPILEEVEKATATSQRRSELNREQARFSEQAAAAAAALSKIDALLEGMSPSPLQAALLAERDLWEERQVIASNRAQAASLQLEELDAQSEGVVGDTTNFIRSFLAERGLNLLMGVLAALGVFFGLRLLMMLVQRLKIGQGPDSFASRIFLLLTNILSIVGAITALLIAFSAAGDLFLLGIVLVFLIGAAWAGIQVIPQFIESLKIILNIGMVREGQRIFFDGVPWHVEQLGFVCILINDRLDGARQVLPVRRLVGLHSRAWCEDEEPFPCQRGDWIQLSDGTTGTTLRQNPDIVTLRELGGSEVTIPTAEFLERSPRNLSRDGFELRCFFGIDYQHQAIATSEVPGFFTAALEKNLPSEVDPEHIKALRVLFARAAASSLDYAIEIDLAPGAAPAARRLEAVVQRILVDACREHGLVIPFTQITLHQATGARGLTPEG